MSERDCIGIVGGMGPYAGVDLLNKIYKSTGAKTDQHHLPVTMVSIPGCIPDRTEYLLNNENENPAFFIAQVIAQLHRNNATVVGMPCNTAHHPKIFNCIKERIPKTVRLINMLDMVKEFIDTLPSTTKRVGILATTGSYKTRLFDHYLAGSGVETIQVSKKTQGEKVQPAIYEKSWGIKAQANPVTKIAKTHLLSSMQELIDKGATSIIMGCTEIAIIESELNIHPDITLIDPTQILAESLIEQFSASNTQETELQLDRYSL